MEFFKKTKMSMETIRLEEKTLMLLQHFDKIVELVENFKIKKRSVIEDQEISKMLEDNQQSLLKIIENGNRMERLFRIVEIEVEKVGEFGNTLVQFDQIIREVI